MNLTICKLNTKNRLRLLNRNMKNLNKILYVTFISLSLFLSSCSDNVVKNASGNWQVKASELSHANPQYIKSDLAKFNPIIESVDMQAHELAKQLEITATNLEKFEQVVVKFGNLQDEMQQKMMQLNLKSSEVQNIRRQMINQIFFSKKLHQLTLSPGFDISSPDENYKKHFKQSEDMREKARAELDDLNKQYS